MKMLERPLTAMKFGERVAIVVDDLDEVATGRYVGYAGGPTAMVELDGTHALVQIPRRWIQREEQT